MKSVDHLINHLRVFRLTMESQTVSQPEFPLFDFSIPELKPGSDEWVSTCKALRIALEDHGAFLVLYNKVDDSIYASSRQLFDLSTQAKMQETSEKPAHGYVGQVPGAPLFESHAVDNPLSQQDCQKFARILWPSGNDFFSEAVSAYAKGLVELDQMLKRMVFESYGIDSEKCESFLESNKYVLRFYKYLPARTDEGENGVLPHPDTTLFTILHQDSEGLEVQNKDDQWVRVDVSPSLFCVVVGDAFSVWSNDRICPRYHQVMIKTKTRPRYSIGLLSYAGQTISPQEELVDDQHPLRYKPFNHYKYLTAIATKEGLNSDYQHRLKEFCGV
ncbi:2-oxoglutarate-dependent dioxygenase AOP2-like [Prosopis cineraria]|uniref:2-oxoglutarate-dependent dioxygenase AOP2-like n=1 Tax=Prosopis cineraria TaxID=364024 RepID=UPI00240F00F0|nr:2-oxoglutarate-dependent dioxygenase AOP2-like [Prosopis cineraria]